MEGEGEERCPDREKPGRKPDQSCKGTRPEGMELAGGRTHPFPQARRKQGLPLPNGPYCRLGREESPYTARPLTELYGKTSLFFPTYLADRHKRGSTRGRGTVHGRRAKQTAPVGNAHLAQYEGAPWENALGNPRELLEGEAGSRPTTSAYELITNK